MGYLFAIFGIFVVLVIIAVAMRGRGGPRSAVHRSATRDQPAADEPTPGASDTASPTRIQNSQRRVPPA